MKKGDIFIGFDRDRENLEAAQKRLETYLASRTENLQAKCIFVNKSFGCLTEILETNHIDGITAICYDLGVSSAHFDDGRRGFSFRFDGPLDMRFDRDSGNTTAEWIINHAKEEKLLQIFREYGEEPKAFFIAKAIVEARNKKPITTTKELADIIEYASFDQKSKLRVFQALRIEVNGEFEEIEASLKQAVAALKPGGRASIITFHSLEDRLVKSILKEYEKDVPDPITGRARIPKVLEKVTKKPIEPSEEEVQKNSRSRSAKLRIVQKLSVPHSL